MATPAGPSLSVAADLDLSLELPGDRTVTGRLTGSGSSLQLEVSDPFVFAGRQDSRSVRGVANALFDQGLSVTVLTPRGPLVTLGAPRTPWWQRRVTGSRHIRIERGAGLWSLARGRARSTGGALPSSSLMPPSTVWPPAPTLLRRRREVSTTHARNGGGNPRLIMAPRKDPFPGDVQPVFPLLREVTTIGSAEGCDVRLPGLAPRHARIWRDERDEFVLVRLTTAGGTTVNGAPVDSAILRTASRVEMGREETGWWTMSFYREEYADHGRPHGGRQGGEIGRQRPQAPRPQGSGGSTSTGSTSGSTSTGSTSTTRSTGTGPPGSSSAGDADWSAPDRSDRDQGDSP